MAVTAHEVLVKADALLSDPERWTTGSYAVNADGEDTEPYHDDAARFCAIGAIDRFAFRDEEQGGIPDFSHERTEAYDAAVDALADEAHAIYRENTIHINDTLGYAAVRRIYAAAIARTGGSL